MHALRKVALLSGLTLAAAGIGVGIAPAASANTINCVQSPGSAYEVCVHVVGTGTAVSSITAYSTSESSGGIDFHVQLVAPNGVTLCNSATKLDTSGTQVSCTWNHGGGALTGNYCTVNWEYMNGEYVQYGRVCAPVPTD